MSLSDRLAARVLELIDVPSESRNESDLAAHVLDVLAPVGARDAGDTCVLAGTTEHGARPLVLLAGHLDTVPAQDNRPGRRDGHAVLGLGAADMKGAVAVMVELALSGLGERAAVDVGYGFFGREELPVVHSALTPLLDREPGLRTADAVIVMEPTANAIHAGCLGNINATWTFRGTSGHSAPPRLPPTRARQPRDPPRRRGDRRPRPGARRAARLRRAAVRPGRVGHAGRGRDRRQRDPRPRRRARELPLRARDEGWAGRGAAALVVRAVRRGADRVQRAVGAGRHAQRPRAAAHRARRSRGRPQPGGA